MPLDRLSRYEAVLWRQAGQILYALDNLDRRKPQERMRHKHSRASGAKSIEGGAASEPFTHLPVQPWL